MILRIIQNQILEQEAKHLNYFEIEDIGYYNVPTPLTEIYAKSTYEQGQILDMLSINKFKSSI